jgi:hypothetical protein
MRNDVDRKGIQEIGPSVRGAKAAVCAAKSTRTA